MGSVSAVSVGEYTTILLVMIDIVKGGGRGMCTRKGPLPLCLLRVGLVLNAYGRNCLLGTGTHFQPK
jgi:hypothetical protein